MHIILLSGGSGKRLWPLSNDVRSKQFLKVLPVAGTTKKESMVQRVYRQILLCKNSWDSVTVAAATSQRDMLKLQLGKDVNVICEPERRDTFPAISLACSYLFSRKGIGADEYIAVCPVDPYVDDSFFECISTLENVLKENNVELALMGARPSEATEKYGYIIPGDDIKCGAQYVCTFKEKPSAIQAKELIEKGALWNCGVFAMKLSYVLDILTEKHNIKDYDFDRLFDNFSLLKKTSFDYEVVERARNIAVVRYDGMWKDLGSWETLTEQMTDAVSGDAIISGDCSGTYVINEGIRPLAVSGVRNCVIVSSPDGVLVADKSTTSQLKEVLKDLKARPMYEKRRWGEYYVLDHITYDDGSEMLTKRLILNKDKSISYQYHEHRKEIWTVIRGRGEVCLNGESSEVSTGDIVRIGENDLHSIKALSDLEIVEVQLGAPLTEEDIIRLQE